MELRRLERLLLSTFEQATGKLELFLGRSRKGPLLVTSNNKRVVTPLQKTCKKYRKVFLKPLIIPLLRETHC